MSSGSAAGSPSGDDLRSTDEELQALLREAARSLSKALELSSVPEVVLMRVGSHIVAQSLDPAYVLRIDCPAADELNTTSRNILVRKIAQRGGPLLAPKLDGTIRVGVDCNATLWPKGSPTESNEIGRLLAELHACSPEGLGLPTWSPDKARQHSMHRIASVAENLPNSIRDELTSRLESTYADEIQDSDSVLAHGDAHPGNTVIYRGRTLFIDTDDLALAPRELDLAPLYVVGRRFRDRDYWREVLGQYGTAKVDNSRLMWFAQAREVSMNCWLATLWNKRPEARLELQHRLQTWDGDEKWHPI